MTDQTNGPIRNERPTRALVHRPASFLPAIMVVPRFVGTLGKLTVARYTPPPCPNNLTLWQRITWRSAWTMASKEVRVLPPVLRDDLLRNRPGHIISAFAVNVVTLAAMTLAPVALREFFHAIPDLANLSTLTRIPAIAETAGYVGITTLGQKAASEVRTWLYSDLHEQTLKMHAQVLAEKAQCPHALVEDNLEADDLTHLESGQAISTLTNLLADRAPKSANNITAFLAAILSTAYLAPWVLAISLPLAVASAGYRLRAKGQMVALDTEIDRAQAHALKKLQRASATDTAIHQYLGIEESQDIQNDLESQANSQKKLDRLRNRKDGLSGWATMIIQNLSFFFLAVAGGNLQTIAAIGGSGSALTAATSLALATGFHTEADSSGKRLERVQRLRNAVESAREYYQFGDTERTLEDFGGAVGLELKDVVVEVGGNTLGPASFSILPGKINVICGPNGAGKTSLLEAALGLRKQTGGTVMVTGVPAAGQDQPRQEPINKLSRATIKRLFGGHTNATDEPLPRLFDLHRDDQNLYQGLSDAGVPPYVVRQFLAGEGASLGQTSRLKTGMALRGAPGTFVILDEPDTGLDAPGVLALERAMAANPSKTYVVVTHSERLILNGAHVILIGTDGHVLDEGTTEKVFGQGATAALAQQSEVTRRILETKQERVPETTEPGNEPAVPTIGLERSFALSEYAEVLNPPQSK